VLAEDLLSSNNIYLLRYLKFLLTIYLPRYSQISCNTWQKVIQERGWGEEERGNGREEEREREREGEEERERRR
jgi:hypothetical protein